MISFRPSLFYIIDIRNVKNEFTAHKQVLFSTEESRHQLLLQHANAVSGLISLSAQFFKDEILQLTLGDDVVTVSQSSDSQVFLVATHNSATTRAVLRTIDAVIASQIQSYTALQRFGLRAARKVLKCILTPLLALLHQGVPQQVLLRTVTPTAVVGWQSLARVMRTDLGLDGLCVFTEDHSFSGSSGVDTAERGLLCTLFYVGQRIKQIRQEIYQDNRDIQFLEPAETSDEYAQRKGTITDDTQEFPPDFVAQFNGNIVITNNIFVSTHIEDAVITQQNLEIDASGDSVSIGSYYYKGEHKKFLHINLLDCNYVLVSQKITPQFASQNFMGLMKQINALYQFNGVIQSRECTQIVIDNLLVVSMANETVIQIRDQYSQSGEANGLQFRIDNGRLVVQ